MASGGLMEFGGRVKTVLRWRREAFVLADCYNGAGRDCA